MGAVIAAQLHERMRADVPEFDAHVECGDFAVVRNWLATHVHSEGARLSPQALVQQATGKPLAAAASLRHLEARYLEEAR
jgi:carboxypeptidase Taq